MAMYYASADELGPTLRGQLLKKHKGSFGATLGERYFEVDDALGCVLLCFKSGEDLHKRLPHHVYPLRDAQVSVPSASEGRLTGRTDKNALGYVTAYALQLEKLGGETRPLVLGHESKSEVDKWVDGLQRRIDSPRCTSRLLTLEVAAAGDTPSGAVRTGLQLTNFSWASVGVKITHVEAGSSAARAGLKAGEALIAVEGVGCLSHVHASKLLHTSAGTSPRSGVVELKVIVATEAPGKPWPKDEAVDVS